jgi:hypothetical protein
MIVDLGYTDLQAFNCSADVTGTVTETDLSDNTFFGALVTPVSNRDADLQINFDPAVTPVGYQPGWYKGAKARMGVIIVNNGPVAAVGGNLSWIADSNLEIGSAGVEVTRPAGGDTSSDACTVDCNPTVVMAAAGYTRSQALGTSDTGGLTTLSTPCLIFCTFGTIAKTEVVKVGIAGRINNATDTKFAHAWVGVVASTNPDPIPIGNQAEHVTWIRVFNKTVDTGEFVPPPQEVVVVPASTGSKFLTYFLMVLIPFLVLLVATIIAWKLGFFKRKRPEEQEDEDEKIENAFGDEVAME